VHLLGQGAGAGSAAEGRVCSTRSGTLVRSITDTLRSMWFST
jgi:hypothetical protein